VRAMRQKNQVELNLGTGAEGEARSAAAREPEMRARRKPVSNARRSRDRRWKQWLSVRM
jgi:hypothetical protein